VPVICISRTLGAGGEEVGQRVAEATGLRYIDNEIVSEAARRLSLPDDVVAEAEAPESWVSRLARSLALSSLSEADPTVFAPEAVLEGDRNLQRALIREVLGETAEAGDAVIVAHGAAMALGASPGVTRVLITASRDVRIARVGEALDLPPREAEREVDASDKARTDYFKRFYDISEELPTHYDLVLNTDAVDAATAAQLVVATANR
jgi:cytidylate kinase